MSTRRRARPGRRLQGGPSDEGMTLTELLVYMVILSIALAIALAAVVQMSRVLLTTTEVTDAATSLWKATSILDRQVRNANAVNVPGPRGSTPAGSDPSGTGCAPGAACFVEFRTTKEATYSPDICPGCAAGTQICTQWWTDPAAGTLMWRWWQDTASPTRSQPVVAVNNLVANASAPAFSPGFGDALLSSYPLQVLRLSLTTQEGDQQSRRDTSYAARNSEAFYQSQVAADWGESACVSVDRNP